MLSILFAFLWCPFHHKPVASPAVAPAIVGVQTSEGHVHFPDSYCPHSDDGYFFLGPDGMVGVAKESCDAAFTDWKTNTGTPILRQVI